MVGPTPPQTPAQFLESVYGITVQLVRRRVRDRRDWDDAIQDTAVHLLSVAHKYDPTRGAAGTFAGACINHFLHRRWNRERQQPAAVDWLDNLAGADDGLRAIEGRFRASAIKTLAARLLQSLSDRERRVIIARYGLGGAEPKTLAQIGRRMGLTRQRVQQIVAVALAKMRATVEGG